MHGRIIAAMGAVILAGCSDEAPVEQRQQRAALTPGEYEASWTVTSLRSSDGTIPATSAAEGATGTARGCVGEDGQIDPALFAEPGDQCMPTDSFIRPGRISIQLECRRSSQPGQILQSATGTSTAERFEGEVSTTTYLADAGDYQMIRTISGRRIGECPAASGLQPG